MKTNMEGNTDLFLIDDSNLIPVNIRTDQKSIAHFPQLNAYQKIMEELK
jgi:hypothetical protein